MGKLGQILVAFCCFFAVVAQAQTPVCTPNVLYTDSAVGVYPRPYIAGDPYSKGIEKPACIGKPYSFVWTLKVPDSVPIAGLGTFPLDSASLTLTGAISGLPTGITYACNPPNCTFKKKTIGCVLLSGTPPAINAVKDYNLVITVKVYTIIATNITFPGAIAPGEYILKLLAANNALCTTATTDLSEVSQMQAVPNPTNGKTAILIESNVSDKFTFTVTDLLGRTVYEVPLSIQSGANAVEFDASHLPNGVYIYTLSKGSRVQSNKLIVNN